MSDLIPDRYPVYYVKIDNKFTLHHRYYGLSYTFRLDDDCQIRGERSTYGLEDYYTSLSHTIINKFHEGTRFNGVNESQTIVVRSKLRKRVECGVNHVLKVIWDQDIAPQIDPELIKYNKNHYRVNRSFLPIQDLKRIRDQFPNYWKDGLVSFIPHLFTPSEKYLDNIQPLNEAKRLTISQFPWPIPKNIALDILNIPLEKPLTSKLELLAYYATQFRSGHQSLLNLNHKQLMKIYRISRERPELQLPTKRIYKTSNIIHFYNKLSQMIHDNEVNLCNI